MKTSTTKCRYCGCSMPYTRLKAQRVCFGCSYKLALRDDPERAAMMRYAAGMRLE